MMDISFKVNGKELHVSVTGNESLLDVLRKNGFTSVKRGCSEGECGACGVIVDGVYLKSCLMLAVQAHGREVMTVEALGDVQEPHPIQVAVVEEGAVQCGFCTPSRILASYSLLQNSPNPSDDEVKEALDGNLCRCTGYVKQLSAVKKAAELIGKEGEA